jgi:hypothetical protein
LTADFEHKIAQMETKFENLKLSVDKSDAKQSFEIVRIREELQNCGFNPFSTQQDHLRVQGSQIQFAQLAQQQTLSSGDPDLKFQALKMDTKKLFDQMKQIMQQTNL